MGWERRKAGGQSRSERSGQGAKPPHKPPGSHTDTPTPRNCHSYPSTHSVNTAYVLSAHNSARYLDHHEEQDGQSPEATSGCPSAVWAAGGFSSAQPTVFLRTSVSNVWRHPKACFHLPKSLTPLKCSYTWTELQTKDPGCPVPQPLDSKLKVNI